MYVAHGTIMRGRANRGRQYSTRRHIALQTIDNMLHVHALLISSSMNRPATKYNSLPSKSQGGREQRLSLAATVEMVNQSSSVLISSAGLRRRQLQEGKHILLSKVVNSSMKLVGCMAAICTIHLIGNGYDDEHRHNTVI